MKRNSHLKSVLSMTLLFLLIFQVSAFASVTKEEALNTAKELVPADCKATEVSCNKKTHVWECEFLTKNKRIEYEVEVDEITGKVKKLEREKIFDKGGKYVRITKAKAKKAVLKLFPDVVITKVKKAKDGGKYIYRVWLTGDGFRGDAEVNAQTAAINEWTKFF